MANASLPWSAPVFLLNGTETTSPVSVGAATILVIVLAAVSVQRFHGSGGNKRPPMVPSYIPWVGSYWEMDRDPDAFMKKCQAMYPGGIFGVKTHGQKHYFITDAKLINQVHRQPKAFSMSPMVMEWITSVFSLSTSARVDKQAYAAIGPHMGAVMTQKYVGGFMEGFATELRRAISENVVVPSATVPLRKFVYDIIWKATGRANFGPSFPLDWYDEYKDFDDGVWKIAAGYPESMMGSFVKSRERTLEIFNQYLESEHDGWEMVSGTEKIGRELGLSRRDMGVLMLMCWWAPMANIPYASYWVMALQLQRPEQFQNLISELDAAGDVWAASQPGHTGKYTDHLLDFFESNPHVPLLNSTLAEMLRFVSDSWSMRGAQKDGVLLGGYEIRENDVLVCSSRQVHFDEKEYGPTVHEYDPRRFINENGGKGKESSHDWMPFGGGVSMCGGRHFAYFHMKCVITTLITTYDFKLDESVEQKVEVGITNRGFGIRRPKGDLYVKVSQK